MELVVLVYKLTDRFPQHELYGLTSQMRRAVVSIPSNIAEGYRRGSRKEYRKYILISFGSASELETQLEISLRLGYATIDDMQEVSRTLEESLRMLNVLARTLDEKMYS